MAGSKSATTVLQASAKTLPDMVGPGPTEIERNDGVRQTLDFDGKPDTDYNPMIDAAPDEKDKSKDQLN